jgi:preprotein translocase subunit YajC
LGLCRRAFEEEFSGIMTNTSLIAAAAAPSGTMAFLVNIFPLLLVFVIFYFLMIRPQQKRMRDHQAQIAAVKKGDRIVTGGGLIGKVTKVNDNEVEVELAQGIRVTAVKSTLTQVIDPTAAKPAND